MNIFLFVPQTTICQRVDFTVTVSVEYWITYPKLFFFYIKIQRTTEKEQLANPNPVVLKLFLLGPPLEEENSQGAPTPTKL